MHYRQQPVFLFVCLFLKKKKKKKKKEKRYINYGEYQEKKRLI